MPIGLMTIINTTQDHCEAVWSYFYRCWWSYGLSRAIVDLRITQGRRGW